MSDKGWMNSDVKLYHNGNNTFWYRGYSMWYEGDSQISIVKNGGPRKWLKKIEWFDLTADDAQSKLDVILDRLEVLR